MGTAVEAHLEDNTLMSKNRLYEVSKSLGITAKAATVILKANGYLVKNNMKILSDEEIKLLKQSSIDCHKDFVHET